MTNSMTEIIIYQLTTIVIFGMCASIDIKVADSKYEKIIAPICIIISLICFIVFVILSLTLINLGYKEYVLNPILNSYLQS